MKLLAITLFLSACTVSTLDRNRAVEYTCEKNGTLTVEWGDAAKEAELKK